VIQAENSPLLLTGKLTSATVPAIFNAGIQRLTGEDMLVDFSQVEMVDSAAVGMLLGWLRAAQQGKHNLQVMGLPADLISLATLYGVADFLPQSS